MPSAQLALGCKAHRDIICIDGSHDFGWFRVGCCGDLRIWGGGDGEFAEGFTFGPFSFKLEILVKFELLMMIQVGKYSGSSSVPVSVILKAGSHVTKIIGFHAIPQIALLFAYWILLY